MPPSNWEPEEPNMRPVLNQNYLVVSTMTIWLWDLLLSLHEDVYIFSGRTFSLSDLAYVVARLATGGFLLCPISSLGTSRSTCIHILLAAGWFEAFALISNSSLFLLRVLAVFSHSWKMKAIFSFLWMFSFMALVTPPSVSLIRMVPGCEFSDVAPVALICFVVVTVFDSLVFLAISIRVLAINRETIEGKTLASFFFGNRLGHVSSLVLRTGQAYYLTTVCVNILTLVALFSSNDTFSPTTKTALTLASMALQNMMGCRTFRLLRMGADAGQNVSTQVESSVQFATQYTTYTLPTANAGEGTQTSPTNATIPNIVGFTVPLNIWV